MLSKYLDRECELSVAVGAHRNFAYYHLVDDIACILPFWRTRHSTQTPSSSYTSRKETWNTGTLRLKPRLRIKVASKPLLLMEHDVGRYEKKISISFPSLYEHTQSTLNQWPYSVGTALEVKDRVHTRGNNYVVRYRNNVISIEEEEMIWQIAILESHYKREWRLGKRFMTCYSHFHGVVQESMFYRTHGNALNGVIVPASNKFHTISNTGLLHLKVHTTNASNASILDSIGNLR